jgi:hypothetical protein
MRQTDTDPRLRGTTAFTVARVVSSVAIGLLGVYTLADVMGVTPG